MAIDLTRDVNTSDKLKVPPRDSNAEEDSGIGRSQSMNAHNYQAIKYIERLQICCGAEGCQHSWDEHGFSISIPSGAVQRGTEASFTFGVSISGNFFLPQNMTLVSPVFCVDAVPNCFEKDVELKISHSLELSQELSEHISFVRASFDTSSFHFEKFPDGIFKPGIDYGVLSTKSFSLFAVAVDRFACGIGVPFIRIATVHFCVPENRNVPVWQVYVYVSQRSRSMRKHIIECNSDRLPGSVTVDAFKIPYSPALSLDFANTSNSGWSISQRTPNKILWDDVVDYSRSPEYPPYIALEVKSTTGSSTGFPGCKISIIDDDGCELKYYQLPSNPVEANHLQSHQDDGGLTMEMLVTKVVPRLATYWEQVGYALDLDKHGETVNIIKQDYPRSVEKCCQELFRRWLRGPSGKSPKTWDTLLQIISNIPELTAVKEELENELQTQ